MNEHEQPMEPTEADVAAALRAWSKERGKTPKQMRHLNDAEVEECYQLAQGYVQARVLRNGSKAEDEA